MARFIFNDYSFTSSVTQMLTNLHWDTLKQRRTQTKLITLYNIVNNILNIPADNILSHTTPPYPIRSHHIHHFNVPMAKIQAYKLSFFPSTIQLWNALPSDTALSPDLESFKDRLEQHFAIAIAN